MGANRGTVAAMIMICGVCLEAESAWAESQARQMAREAYETFRSHPFETSLIEAAAKKLDQANKLDPTEPYVLLGAAALVLDVGFHTGERWDIRSYDLEALTRATGLALKAVEKDPSIAESHLELASLYIIQRRFSDAQHEYFVAHQLDPESFRLWLGQATCSWSQGDVKRAEAALAGAIARAHTADEKQNVNVLKKRMARARGDLAELEKIYKEDIALEPDDPWNHGNYAGFLERLGRLDEAIAEYEKAIKLGPYPVAVQGLENAKKRREELEKSNPH